MTIRDVPDETRAELAARAARSGQSLQEYVRGQLTAWASRPGPEDVRLSRAGGPRCPFRTPPGGPGS